MTVTSSTLKSRYTGNGVTTAFTGSFTILDEDHVLVTLTDTSGVDEVQTITTDYTVSGVNGASHTVTFLVAPPSGYTVTLSRNVPATQELDLVENDDMPADDLEKAFDKNVMLVQQIKEAIDRSVRFPVSDSTSRTAELPSASLRASKFLKFDADGDADVAALADIGASAFASAADMTAGTSTDTLVAPKELTEWAPASVALASTDEILIRDASDSGKIKRAALAGALTYAMLQNVSATARILGRKTAAAGVAEECTLSEILDFIGSAAQGDILYRDGSAWARLAAGTSGHYLKTQGAGANPTWAAVSAGPTNGTAVATTSGTAIQFTGIPSTVKRIIVSIAGVSTNGSSNILLQIGPSGGVETSGYDSYTAVDVGGTNATVNSSAGHVIRNANAARAYTGHFDLTLLNASTNLWVISCMVYDNGVQQQMLGASQKTLAGTLERLRITTAGGADTFDAGSMNIMYD